MGPRRRSSKRASIVYGQVIRDYSARTSASNTPPTRKEHSGWIFSNSTLPGFPLDSNRGAYRIRKRWSDCGQRSSLAANCGFRRRGRRAARRYSSRLRGVAGDLCSRKHRRGYCRPRAPTRRLGLARGRRRKAASLGTSWRRCEARPTAQVGGAAVALELRISFSRTSRAAPA